MKVLFQVIWKFVCFKFPLCYVVWKAGGRLLIERVCFFYSESNLLVVLVFEPEQENMWNWLGWKLKPLPKICKTVQILCIENQS